MHCCCMVCENWYTSGKKCDCTTSIV